MNIIQVLIKNMENITSVYSMESINSKFVKINPKKIKRSQESDDFGDNWSDEP